MLGTTTRKGITLQKSTDHRPGYGTSTSTTNWSPKDQTQLDTELNSKPEQKSKGDTMNIKKAILLMVVTGVLTACGGGDDAPANKPLFSKWTSPNGIEYDLTGLDYEVQYPITIALTINMGCYCNLRVTGSEQSGNIYLSSCVHYGPQNYCSSSTTQYNYTKVGATLNVCDGWDQNCETYR